MSGEFTKEPGKSLEKFAAAGQDENRMPAVIPQVATTLAGQRIVGAQQVAVMRNEVHVLAKLKALAAQAGGDWYYRFPVQDKGRTKYIEGPSIKLANDLARIYGNCDVDCTLVIDIGDFWMIHARFTDYETGFSISRPWQQPKTGSRLGGDDEDRRQGISMQIGVSKAERNVVTNALQTFSDYAFQQARSSMIDDIGKDLPGWRKKASERLGQMNVLARAEALVGKSLKDWLAPDIARMRAMVVAIDDGMASVDESFPPLPSEKKEAKPKSGVADFGGEASGQADQNAEVVTETDAGGEDEEEVVFGGKQEAVKEEPAFKGEKVLAAAIAACKAQKDLKDLWDANIQPHEEAMGKEMFGRLSEAANARQKALKRAGQAAKK